MLNLWHISTGEPAGAAALVRSAAQSLAPGGAQCLRDCSVNVYSPLSWKLPVVCSSKKPQRRQNGRRQNIGWLAERTIGTDGSETIFLPGASLKGALRAQAERIARSLNHHNAGACHPFTTLSQGAATLPTDLACSERMKVRMQCEQREGNELTTPEHLP